MSSKTGSSLRFSASSSSLPELWSASFFLDFLFLPFSSESASSACIFSFSILCALASSSRCRASSSSIPNVMVASTSNGCENESDTGDIDTSSTSAYSVIDGRGSSVPFHALVSTTDQ
eukprot:jgi/Picsp_1/5631/NSC_02990-R1_---NA---